MKKIIVFAVVFLVGVAIVGSLAVRSTNAEQFFKGDKVKVTRTVNSAVVSERPWAGNLQIGTQPKDAMGIVTDGPQDLFGHHYYEVNFDTGVDGWVEDTDLGLVFREAPIPGSPSPSTKFQIGTVIAVSSSVGVSVNVRSEPKIVVTNVIGSHYGGDKGTVVDGPRSGDGYNWWFVSFNDAPDGWVAENLVEAVSPQPVPSTKFAINDRVGIPLGYGLKVRSYPYGEVVGTHQRGAQGVVMGGAIYAGQRYWWKINFDSGDDGWFEEGYLYKISGKFRAGDSVQVTVGPNQQIRVGSFRASSDLENYFVGYDGVLLGNHNDGESGSVTGGPKFYKDAWWWSVDYQNFPDGWSPESGLAFSGTLPPSAGGDFSLSKPVAGATYQRGVNLVVYWGALPVDNNWPVGLTVKLAGPYNDLNNTPTERTIITRGAEVDPRRGIPYYQAQSGWLISSDVKDGLYVVIAIANYSANGSDRTSISGAFTISGTAPPGGGTNQPPVITSVSGPISTTVGQPGSWTVLASDPEGGVLTYEVNWGDSSATSSQTGSVFSHTYASLGTYTIRATVKDTSGASGEGTLSVTVTGAGGQVSPTFAIGDRVIVIDYVPSVTANNCLTDPLSSGTFHGAISPRQLGTIVGGPSVYFGTEHPLWLVDYYGVSVAGSCWSWESSLKKLPPPANQPPVVDDFSSTQIFWEVNKDFDVDLSVSDPDGNLASYKIDWGDSQSTGPITISGTSTTKSESHKYTNTARNIIAKLT
ncbi:MAG: PKD domain-containing protein, partial [Candidatus Sungbacteria bacterium]|nr:PKD domain-containing protein [Candidatus Sungbacteria bacterium]